MESLINVEYVEHLVTFKEGVRFWSRKFERRRLTWILPETMAFRDLYVDTFGDLNLVIYVSEKNNMVPMY